MEEEKDTCACGCEEEEDDVVMLEDEDGKQVAFHYITTLEHEGKEYVYLQAAEEEEDEDACLEIYELETHEEEGELYDNLLPIDDDLYEVLYEKLMKEIEEGEDDCDDPDCDCHHHHHEED